MNDLGANLQKAFDAMANARTDTEGKRAMAAPFAPVPVEPPASSETGHCLCFAQALPGMGRPRPGIPRRRSHRPARQPPSAPERHAFSPFQAASCRFFARLPPPPCGPRPFCPAIPPRFPPSHLFRSASEGTAANIRSMYGSRHLFTETEPKSVRAKSARALRRLDASDNAHCLCFAFAQVV